MTDKKNVNDFNFDENDDFDFGDPVLSKDFNSEDNPPTAMVAETNDFDFDDIDTVVAEPKPIWIRKIECTNLNELDQQIVRTLISFRDYTKSTQKFSNAIIQNEFANADQDGKTDFIVKKVCLHIVERKKMSIHVKHYYLAKFEEYLVEVFTQEAKHQFDKFASEVKQEVKEGFDEMRKQIV